MPCIKETSCGHRSTQQKHEACRNAERGLTSARVHSPLSSRNFFAGNCEKQGSKALRDDGLLGDTVAPILSIIQT
jgi:hypothetical protein